MSTTAAPVEEVPVEEDPAVDEPTFDELSFDPVPDLASVFDFLISFKMSTNPDVLLFDPPVDERRLFEAPVDEAAADPDPSIRDMRIS